MPNIAKITDGNCTYIGTIETVSSVVDEESNEFFKLEGRFAVANADVLVNRQLNYVYFTAPFIVQPVTKHEIEAFCKLECEWEAKEFIISQLKMFRPDVNLVNDFTDDLKHYIQHNTQRAGFVERVIIEEFTNKVREAMQEAINCKEPECGEAGNESESDPFWRNIGRDIVNGANQRGVRSRSTYGESYNPSDVVQAWLNAAVYLK